jgi:hypothetical protein
MGRNGGFWRNCDPVVTASCPLCSNSDGWLDDHYEGAKPSLNAITANVGNGPDNGRAFKGLEGIRTDDPDVLISANVVKFHVFLTPFRLQRTRANMNSAVRVLDHFDGSPRNEKQGEDEVALNSKDKSSSHIKP